MENLKKVKACGCVIIENNRVLLIQQTKGHWGFPKGHMEDGETELQTAIREVKEETNLDVEVDANKRYTIRYITNKNKDKEVVFFVAKKIGGSEKYQESEIKAMEWMTFEDALKTITHNNTKELFCKILKDENMLKN